jgi:hypothetical protein
MAEWMVLLAGCYDLAFGLFHVFAWRGLGLARELRYGTRVTYALCLILNAACAYLLAVVGAVCAAYRTDVAAQAPGRALLAAMAVFWAGRGMAQVALIPIPVRGNHPWIAVFLLGAVLHALAAAGGWSR